MSIPAGKKSLLPVDSYTAMIGPESNLLSSASVLGSPAPVDEGDSTLEANRGKNATLWWIMPQKALEKSEFQKGCHQTCEISCPVNT